MAMELLRGVCSLCSENTRILTSSDAEEYSKFLPNILYENFLPEAEFQKIKRLIKICTLCCYKIQIAIEVKDVLSNTNDFPTPDGNVCCFCKTDKCLMQVDKNWKNFLDRIEGYLTSSNFTFCTKCYFYFDAIYNFKTKLSYKFPHLATQKKKSRETPQKSDTPKRRSLPKSPPGSKKRKIFDNCFTYLQPLCNHNYQVNEELKGDKRLYKKIAYVNLKDVMDVGVKETPKTRPVIKIKLKPRNKKGEKDAGGKIEYHITKSEEMPIESGQPKSRRRHSYVERTEPPEELEEKLNETPKSAIVSNLVPKRRVSKLLDNGEKEETQEDNSEENEEELKTEENTDETATAERSKSPEEPKEEKSEELEKNGIDKSDSENIEGNVSAEIPQSENVVNGENLIPAVEVTEEQEPQKGINEDSNSTDSSNSSGVKTKSESSSEGGDSDSNDPKDKSKENSDTDVLNGSERKKKRVTFSDEINN